MSKRSTRRHGSELFNRSVELLERRTMLSSAVAATISPLDVNPAARYVPATSTQWRSGTYLTGVSTAKPIDLALNYFKANAALFGLSATDIGNPIITDQYTDSDSGMTHIYLRQQINGLEVANADANANVAKDGRILSFNSAFVAGAAGKLTGKSITPALTGTTALLRAGDRLGIAHTARSTVSKVLAGPAQIGVLQQSELSTDAIATRLRYVAAPDGVHLAWNYILDVPGGQHWYDTSVDANTGALLFTADWTSSDSFSPTGSNTTTTKTTSAGKTVSTPASSKPTSTGSSASPALTPAAAYNASYNVFPYPTAKNPDSGSRSLVVNPWDLTASPFGWQDTNGTAAPDTNLTAGNNVSAQDDIDANNSGGTQPGGGADINNQVYDFPIDLTQAPNTENGTVKNISSAVVNLYYWNNILHDLHYKYGFTEAAGNFQLNNYGNGGAANDRVQADAQDGSGIDNANFSTPADGSSGRMQMFVWDFTSPNRDGDYDAQIFVHEFGHGVSTRLTGGPANSSSLNALQSGGMGEGWGDWWSMMLLQTDGSNAALNAAYPMASYSVGENPAGPGLRRYPYSFDKASDPMTFTMFNSSTEVHATGEIWATTLWDMSVLLEKKYGFNSNISAGYTTSAGSGNLLALKLVMDALKLQPSNPSLTQARDAILQADTALTGGANAREIWTAFARRGLGFSTFDSSVNASTVTNAWDIPASLAAPAITQTGPMAANYLSSLSSITFQFSEAINTASFSTASDVTFTSPTGADLTSQISGAVFSNSNKTLTISFAPQSIDGNYTMTVGPNIQAADNNANMDQNLNGTSGEAGDSYTATIALTMRPGPDAGNYTASPTTFDATALTGTTTLLDNQDDTGLSIPLAGNTFNFYGTTYTGSNQLYVMDNGIIVFGTAPASGSNFNNGNMTFSPVAPIIAPLWDDWATDITANNDKVVYKLDAPNNKLSIEWSSITNRMDGTSSTNTATFRVVLSLNTGAGNGDIVFNYADLSVGPANAVGAAYSNGGSATVGIKAAGLQGANGNNSRLLLSLFSNPNTWLADATAIRFSTTRATGNVFADDNGNGTIDGGETAVPAARVYADLNNNGQLDAATEPNVLTDGSGNYQLGSLPSGSVTVRQAIGPTWIQTTPAPVTFTATMGTASAGKNIGVFNDALAGTSGADTLNISTNVANDRVVMALTAGGPVHNYSILKSVLPTLSFAGGSGSDIVTVDLGNGDPFFNFTSRFIFTGTGADTLNVMGSSGAFSLTTDPSLDTPNLTVNVSGSANVSFTALATHLTALNVSGTSRVSIPPGGNKLLVTHGLSILGNSLLDMYDNDAVIFYPGSSVLSTIEGYIKSARNTGNWDGANGMTSTTATSVPKDTTLGAIESSQYTLGPSFDGESPLTNAVLVKYTYYGDANFNGQVDGGDYARVDFDFSQQTTLGNVGGWANGDFNYDGKIDGSDYGFIDFAFGAQFGIL